MTKEEKNKFKKKYPRGSTIFPKNIDISRTYILVGRPYKIIQHYFKYETPCISIREHIHGLVIRLNENDFFLEEVLPSEDEGVYDL